MQLVDRILRLSATDLANHLGCAYLSQRSRAAAEGRAVKPQRHDPLAVILKERGITHEAAYLEHLRAQGLRITTIAADDGRGSREQTLAAMRAGVDVIYQAPLGNERWYGRADFLLKTAAPSALGPWSYEIVDAKLATETRAGTILQLCVYSELLAAAQGATPESAYVVAPHHNFRRERHRLADYTAYYRLVKRRLEEAIALEEAEIAAVYPEPAAHCEVCAWWGPCNDRRRADDHLCFVADISRLQIKELVRIDVATLERLGELREVPRPARGSRDALTRARDQARIQLDARRRQTPLYEILGPLDAEHGLARLPAPSPHDVFLDLEGDRLAVEGGRDYLFGTVTAADGALRYTPRWATTPAEEQQGFEALVDAIIAVHRAHPDAHVYHFGAYEPTAFKRLSGRYATRERELDEMLRAELFVDLHTVVRHAVRASVESYSIKELEQFYGFDREQDLRAATASRRAIEWAIEMRQDARSGELAPHIAAVERYNREDCVSTAKLRDWLETLREAELARGAELPRPAAVSGEASERIAETEAETARVMQALLEGVPPDPEERTALQQGRWLMAHLLEWHRREEKAAWWEYFRLRDLPLDEYRDERSALEGLEQQGPIEGGTARRPLFRYSFPPQDHDIRAGDDACVPPEGAVLGKVTAIDVANHTIDIQHGARFADEVPERLFVRRNVPAGTKPAALLELGRWIAEHGIDSPSDEHRAARDLILRLPPRLGAGADSPEPEEARDPEVAEACRRAFALEGGVLPIQGPPGTGKTFTGSHMILALLAAGRKVGVTAVSHEVIRNLLQGVAERAAEQKQDDFKCLHKGAAKEGYADAIHAIDDNGRAAKLFTSGDYGLAGGTAWFWSRPELARSADVLFIDEAGQMSLADVLAVAAGAKSLVLLGDPQQLEQPQQASHPPGTQASALEHILGGAKTIDEDRGLFLKQTRRLHPDICAFTAEVFYEGKLTSYKDLERQTLVYDSGARAAELGAAGLVYVPVDHEGNQARAAEEVTAIAALVSELTAGAVRWRDAAGRESPLTPADLMVVAPYNAQVTALASALPGVRVGTVDKFQGQQAPVVIVSLTTSSPDEAPRGMSFLYSSNRLNVATSRAKVLCVLVGSRKLFEPDCRTPEQMRLANAFCRYLELSRSVARPVSDVNAVTEPPQPGGQSGGTFMEEPAQ